MFHVLYFGASPAAGVLSPISAVADGVFSTHGKGYVTPQDIYVFCALGMSANIEAVQLRTERRTGTVKDLGPMEVFPLVLASNIPSDPNIAQYTENPFEVNAGETLSVFGKDSAGSGMHVAAWITQTLRSAPPGPTVTVSGTYDKSSTAAGKWTTLEMSWSNSLPEGNYGVVGGEVRSATAFCYRLVFPDQSYRPGGPAIAGVSAGSRGPCLFSDSKLGLWGEFNALAPPLIEVVTTSADAYVEARLAAVPLS